MSNLASCRMLIVCFIVDVAIFITGTQCGCISGVANQKNPTHSSCLSDSANLVEARPADATYQAAILNAHNAYRASSALKPTPNPPLANLTWNTDLATTAQEWANQCNNNNDDVNARNVPAQGWTIVQQNMAIVCNNSKLDMALYLQAIAAFGKGKADFTYGVQPSNVVPLILYVQMIWAKTVSVGCGAAHCNGLLSSENKFQYLVVCNYGPGLNYSNDAYPYEVSKGQVLASKATSETKMLAALVVTSIAGAIAAIWFRN